MDTTILELFGVSPADLGMVAGAVWVIIEFIKGKLGTAWATVPKWGRDLIPLVIAGLISYKVSAVGGPPDWWQVASLAVAAWMAPVAVHKARKVKP